MSVSVTVTPSVALYEGGITDYRLPAGRWWGRGVITGDGTGGTATVIVQLFEAADPPNTFCWALDTAFASITSGGNQNVRVQSTGFTQAPGGAEQPQSWIIETATSTTAERSRGRDLISGLLLGVRAAGGEQQIAGVFPTNVNGADHVLEVQGTWWLQDAVLLLGGAQRDVTRLPGPPPVQTRGTYDQIRRGEPIQAAVLGPPVVIEAGTGQRVVPPRPTVVSASPGAVQQPVSVSQFQVRGAPVSGSVQTAIARPASSGRTPSQPPVSVAQFQVKGIGVSVGRSSGASAGRSTATTSKPAVTRTIQNRALAAALKARYG